MYKVGEWMIWTDNIAYECLVDTDRGPDSLPNSWRAKASAPVEPPIEEPPVEEPPQELNSNGTVKWALWVNPLLGTVSSYGANDGVTDESGVRWISLYGGNGNPPSAGWWQQA